MADRLSDSVIEVLHSILERYGINPQLKGSFGCLAVIGCGDGYGSHTAAYCFNAAVRTDLCNALVGGRVVDVKHGCILVQLRNNAP